MKKLLLLLMSIILIAPTSEAQLVRSRTFSKSERNNYNRISFGYDAQFFNERWPTFNGVMIQYIHGFGIGKQPLFLELGLSSNYNVYNDRNEPVHLVSVKVPVNLSYRFNINEKFSISPLVGFNLRFNPAFSDYAMSTNEEFQQNGYYYYHYTSPNDQNIFQAGAQIGAIIGWSKLNIGMSYGFDFLPFTKLNNSIYRCNEYNSSYNAERIDQYESTLKSSNFSIYLGIQF